MKKRIIAIHLPQFHPFPENDEWWGKGFTEWTNVTKAKPRFPGHYQPQLPSDTGFYDMRLPETRQLQADLAKEYSIDGFCYYHYWFNGKMLMERPFNDILSSGEPDFPFMLCWANENWARNWDGGEKAVLIQQYYSEEDDLMHIRWLCEKVFPDRRYIRIDGKPVFAIYRPNEIPNPSETLERWRRCAKEEYGFDLYLIGFEKSHEEGSKYSRLGFDASMDFQPVSLNGYEKHSFISYPYLIWGKLFRSIKNPIPFFLSYKKYTQHKIEENPVSYKMFPCVSPGWDNSCRRVKQSFTVFLGNTPRLFKKWLSATISKFNPYGADENLVFINAWNEWSEGAYLEPDEVCRRAR